MNRTLKNTTIAGTFFFAGTLLSGVSWAHDEDGQLGKKASGTDVWEVSCSGGSQYLAIRIIDLPPSKGPKLSLQIVKDRIAVNTTDAQDADAEYSPEVKLFGGDGIYTVLVDKSGAQPENYHFEAHCWGPSGHTGTTAVAYGQG